MNGKNRSKKTLLFIVGIVLIFLVPIGAALSYSLLPPGRYPAIIIGIGALPPLLAGTLLIKQNAAPGLWEFHKRHTGISALIIIFIAFSMLMVIAAITER